MVLLGLLALFIVVPLAELYLILRVGDALGVLPTVLLLAADSVLGSLLLRWQGRTVWRRFTAAMGEGRVPQREVLDGVLVIFGGAFLITPGFLTDVVGLLCLLPPTRVVIRRLVVRWLGRRAVVRVARYAGTRADRPHDVDGSATEVDAPPRLER